MGAKQIDEANKKPPEGGNNRKKAREGDVKETNQVHLARNHANQWCGGSRESTSGNIFIACEETVGLKELAVGTRVNLINDCRVRIYEHFPGHV